MLQLSKGQSLGIESSFQTKETQREKKKKNKKKKKKNEKSKEKYIKIMAWLVYPMGAHISSVFINTNMAWKGKYLEKIQLINKIIMNSYKSLHFLHKRPNYNLYLYIYGK
jgi:hypothetical protein